MKSLQKIIMILMVATAVATIRYCSKPTRRNSEIVVGTSADFAPFSFIDNSGTIVGFDIDLIKEIFSRLQTEYHFENMPFETLLTQMQFGSIDVIAAGMSHTPERAEHVLFSTPYIEADPLVIVTLSNNKTINSVNDLSGKNVAVNQGYVADLQLSQKPEINLLRLPSISDAVLALKHGKVQAFVTGGGTIKPLQDALGSEAIRLISIPELQEYTALGISKKSPQLKEKIDMVLQEMQKDGTLTVLKEKWHLT
ncbi:MAG: transporter substrate-binding domain-containing protein [Candidatus Babeliaceae bacterium]|nr:transporter substrate-binding domain-containing protein [Candidatus Babeliaceae bacterium]